MENYPKVITMEGKEKEVVVYDLRGYFKFVVADGIVLVDPSYLGELFSYMVVREMKLITCK